MQAKRSSLLDSTRVDGILRLFGDLGLESEAGLREHGDFGLPELRIQEKEVADGVQVSFQDWVGPPNAIEGYVPQIDRNVKPSRTKNRKVDLKSSFVKGGGTFFNETDFTSTIIMGDNYSISKSLGPTKSVSKNNDSKEQFTLVESNSVTLQNDSEGKPRESEVGNSKIVAAEEVSTLGVTLKPCQINTALNHGEAKEEMPVEKVYQLSEGMPKSSLKAPGAKRLAHSVTWADERASAVDSRNLCGDRKMEVIEESVERLNIADVRDDDTLVRCASAEACAEALSVAAEAAASGEFDVSDAVSEAGIVILPHTLEVKEGNCLGGVTVLEPEPALVKWPAKQGISHTDFFESEDSWFDAPPEGFNLTLSPFATMWNALFSWISSSSLAYLYGRDESSHEDFLSVNGREYPQKIVLSDGRSSEIKQTLAGCLARALPGLVADLRLPTPLSILEQGLGHLLETMSFMDALPSFRMKQWQVVALLFIDALSVCRIPVLAPHMTSRRILLHKVLDGAQVSVEEYEMMKDIVIPLGRVPHFSSQSGG